MSGFDSDNLDWWHPTGTVTWASGASNDADGCPNSGSIRLGPDGYISQCISITVGTRYYFGVRYRVTETGTQLLCNYDFRTYACADTTYITARFGGGNSTSWTASATGSNVNSDIAPDGAYTLSINCHVNGTSQAYVDQLFVNAGTFSGF
jgi:hypothetical protein